MSWSNGSRDLLPGSGAFLADAGCGCPALLLPGVLPQGSILGDVLQKEQLPLGVSLGLLGLASLLAFATPFMPSILSRWLGLAHSWEVWPLLAQMGCTRRSVAPAVASVLIVGLFIGIVDHHGLSWPAWWDVDQTCTYHAMFCEPTQASRLVRHPGNAYSNVVYLFNALMVLALQKEHRSPLRMPDACFGQALLLHAVASFLWHASNAPKVHYLDLAAMDSVIIYLQIRWACLIVKKWCKLSEFVEAMLCLALFVAVLAYQVELNLHRWQVGSMDRGFPTGRSCLLAEGGLPLYEVCLFIATPLLYYSIPCLGIIATRSVGSLPLAIASLVSLVIGWEVHLLERWALDGLCVPTAGVLGAIVSPTAIFHCMTGLTLMVAYLHVRSLEYVKP